MSIILLRHSTQSVNLWATDEDEEEKTEAFSIDYCRGCWFSLLIWNILTLIAHSIPSFYFLFHSWLNNVKEHNQLGNRHIYIEKFFFCWKIKIYVVVIACIIMENWFFFLVDIKRLRMVFLYPSILFSSISLESFNVDDAEIILRSLFFSLTHSLQI